MNVKRFLLASLAVFVTFQILDFVIHGLIMGDAYMATASVWRPDMMDLMWLMYVASAFSSLLFVYIFIKGYQNKGVMEGIRYGIIMGLLLIGAGTLNQYVVYPVPGDIAIKWVIFGLPEVVIGGIVAALIYKPKS